MAELDIKKNKISSKIFRKILRETKQFDNVLSSYFTLEKNQEIKVLKKNKNKRKNAYTVFSSKFRSKVKNDNPDKKFGQISKIIGKQWNNLSKEEKNKYREEALTLNKEVRNSFDDKSEDISKDNDDSINNIEKQNILFDKQFEKLIQTFHNILFDIVLKDISTKYDINIEDLVKTIPYNNKKYKKNAYTVFSSHHRKKIKIENPEKSFGEISKIVGTMWKNIPQEEKNEYKLLAEKKNKQYE
jgi:hypothetical protein